MNLGFKELLDFISPVYLWGIWVVFLGVFAVLTVAIKYHWDNYTVDKKRAKKIMRMYYFVSLGLLGVMGLAALMFSI